ncbi:MarR family transcriptional regulator [Ferrovibrio terrae]|uniref:MarR family transcriptional regulator n=1 Tax=Ferrovibrio terrae TaxID=2594003 RepID=A0A516GXY6_9PROT|nr:MarR family transcriptional regulator [Ferrovibrio terrae]QDO96404.1 MarR family transcriptional regulator [Ferrovibrio terrae]
MRGTERLAVVEATTPRMERAIPDLPTDTALMVRLIRITLYGMGQYFEPVFRDIGMNESSFHALCLLVSNDRGSAYPADLAELVGVTRANMTRILDGMVGRGLATRETDALDGRRAVIRVTAAGRKAVREGVPKLAIPLKAAFAEFTEEEFRQFDYLLRKLILSFDKGVIARLTAA